ncbi:MAG TPA: hypothetical protein VN711_00485, partial [Candidatus Saccharimonadales bacterium]|nr:hypothetical protein [Candidatus Saccharimonadales bacterium]
MRKLLTWLDNNLLKFGIIAAILFIPLYPKLPSVHIVRTWVYIRLEDFLIAALASVWFIQLIRRKVKLPLPVGIPLVVYWVSGLITLVYSLLIVGPHLAGFFPHIAALEYVRRIEYMILFFVAFTTVQSIKDLKNYVITLGVALVGILVYGFGQRYYLNLWAAFPNFFTQHAFCFPSFQTGNEEFAKGIPLCLPSDARITSTFGGHYDLAAYLVVVVPLFIALFVTAKKVWMKISTGILSLLSLMLLNFTASRVSFFSYLLGSIAALIFLGKKKWIAPVVILSALVLLLFSGSTAKRLLETFRLVNVVTNSQGQVVGVAENNLPDSLQKKISKDQSVVVNSPPPTQNLPTGSSFITLPTAPTATSVAIVKNQIPSTEALKLKLQYGGLEVSTVSGTFLIKQALVYDISFTTRSQGEWPNAWAAFIKNPPFGQGYSTITLATDNDYLRLLGESGFMGFLTFIGIFVILGIFLTDTIRKADPFARVVALGLAGGVIGLFANATLIDVFEASKVAEPFWLLLGLAVGGLSLQGNMSVAYGAKLKKILTSHIALGVYTLIGVFLVFGQGLQNFFVGDDFTWLKWAATTLPGDLTRNFVNANGFFYRPLDKTVVFFLYNFFAFQPLGYHLFTALLEFLMVFGVYLLGLFVFKRKLWAFLMAVIFLITPLSSEVVFWFSTISISLSSVFLLYGFLSYIFFRTREAKKFSVFYLLSILFAALGLISYEMAVIFPLLLVLGDLLLTGKKWSWKNLWLYAPFVLLDAIYLFIRSHANVVPLSGDYAYSLPHLVPNAIGNSLGYICMFFSGTGVFSWYTPLRSHMRAFALPVGLGGLIVLVLAAAVVWKKHTISLTHETTKIVLFALLWTYISLLPFIGLGNITERYGYFAAIGLAMLFVLILQMIEKRI